MFSPKIWRWVSKPVTFKPHLNSRYLNSFISCYQNASYWELFFYLCKQKMENNTSSSKIAIEWFEGLSNLWLELITLNLKGWVMVFNTTFNNISVILWWSVLLMGETAENHRPVASHWQTLSHNVVSSTPGWSGIRTHNFSANRYWLHR
jgi:hypothetical protein